MPHTEHSWLLTALWVFIWAAKLVYLEKALPHTEQINSFSLAWALICSNSLNDWEKDFPQMLQQNGRSPKNKKLYCVLSYTQSLFVAPVCVLKCLVRSSDLVNPLPHSLHKCLRAPSCTFICLQRVLALAKLKLQTLHRCLFSFGWLVLTWI